jgi:predicted DCC family thiol-disulfide oxidoreductase YuxK
MEAPEKPLVIYDGDCGLCREAVARWRRATGDRVDYAPYQDVASRFPDLPFERFRESVHLIEPDGRRSQGAEAVVRTLALAPGRGWLLTLFRRVPGLARAGEWCYRRVARNRHYW